MSFVSKIRQAIARCFGYREEQEESAPSIEPELPPVTLMRPEELARIYGCSRSLAELYVGHLEYAMARYAINTPIRMAHFLAQVGHESGRLRYAKEIWGPTDAQKRYERDFSAPWPTSGSEAKQPEFARNRLAYNLGNRVEGDGKRYMGRGLIQLTGRSNYEQMSKALGIDVVSVPQLVEFPDTAALSAAWYWDSRRCNRFADLDDILNVTKLINGGTNGLVDRQTLLRSAKSVLMPEKSSDQWAGPPNKE